MLRTIRSTRSLPSLRSTALAQSHPQLPPLQIDLSRSVATKTPKTRKSAANLIDEPKPRGRPRKAVAVKTQKRSSSTDAKKKEQSVPKIPQPDSKRRKRDVNNVPMSAEGVTQPVTESAQGKSSTGTVSAEVKGGKDKALPDLPAQQFADAAVNAISQGNVKQVESLVSSIKQDTKHTKNDDKDKKNENEEKKGNDGKEDYSSGEIPKSEKRGLLAVLGVTIAWFSYK